MMLEEKMDKASIKQELIKWRKFYHNGQRCWSVAYYGAVYASIASSVIATIFLQSDHEQFATIFTTAAAALTSLSVSGGFERKWRSNRLSRCRMDLLLLDIESNAPDLDNIISQIKETISKHDAEIVKYEKITTVV